MSVTFWVPAAPREHVHVPCDFGKGMDWACRDGNRCGYCQDGMQEEVRTLAPEMNVHNGGAAAILGALGVPSESSGEWLPGEIPRVRRAIVAALNSDRCERQTTPAEAYGGPGTGHARVISGGIGVEYIRERLCSLDAILAYAQSNGWGVAWS